MNILNYFRLRKNVSQKELATATKLTANDISRFERGCVLGIHKVVALANYLHITVDALVTNDLAAAVSTLSTPVQASHRLSHALDKVRARNSELGRLGEDWVCALETAKLEGTPYAYAVNPNYADDPDAGYDILSFTKDGTPIFIEVKTTTGTFSRKFNMTCAEVAKARQCLSSGERYEIHRVYRFGTESVGRIIITAEELFREYAVQPKDYEVFQKEAA